MSIKIEVRGEGTVQFGVMSLPNRKNKLLYTTRGAMIEPLAYFINDDCADQFNKIIDFMLEHLPREGRGGNYD
jgi:hypothetical protein